MDCRLTAQNGRVCVSDHSGQILDRVPRADATLIRGLQAGHKLVATAGDNPFGRPGLVSFQKSLPSPYFRALMRLSFLAPDLQAMILEGRQPATLSLARLLAGDVPILSEDQRRMLGIV